MTPSPTPAVVVVVTTAPDAEVAESIATQLVQERLAACANLVPGVTSIYRWRGEVQRDSEVLVVLKSTEEASATLRDRIVELHPYEVPEVLMLPVPKGSDAYLTWVGAEVGEP